MAIREALTGALSLAASARQIISPNLPPKEHARGVARALDRIESAQKSTRQDGWVNVATGFGTSRDKTGGTYYLAPGWLSDAELADLYNFNDLAAKTVNLPIREAFKTGYCITGLDDPERLEEIENYLKPFGLLTKTKQVATWADLFGGAALWFRFADGKDPALPLTEPPDPLAPAATQEPVQLPAIDAIEVIDKRFLFPFRWYTDGPKAGRPMTYQLWVPRNGGVNSLMGEIHESRLVCFYSSAPTELLDKLRRQGWNQPVLQRVYEALQAAGIVWKAIDILVADANQAVYSIKGLWRMITGDPTQAQDSTSGSDNPSGGLLNRIRFMDLMRSVSRAIVLDLEDETFERKPTTFTGLPELSERQWVRVSAATDIPLPLLTGEYPGGLNASGEGPFRVFYAAVSSRREEDFGPKLLESIKLILSAQGAPELSAEELAGLGIQWLPLWEPTAAELADIQLKTVQAGDVLVQNQAISPEELIKSLPKEWYPGVDHDLRDEHLETMTEVPSVTKANADAEQAEADRKAQAELATAKGPPVPAGKPGAVPPKGPPKTA